MGKKVGDTLTFLLNGVLSGDLPNEFDELRHAAVRYIGPIDKD